MVLHNSGYSTRRGRHRQDEAVIDRPICGKKVHLH